MAESPAPVAEAAFQQRIAKNAVVLMVFTMASRVAGLVRDFSMSHFFGASGVSDVFYMAFTIPNVLRRLVAEGSLTVTFQPAYQRMRRDQGDVAARMFLAQVLGGLLLLLMIITTLGIIAAPWLVRAFASGFLADETKFLLTVELTRWLFPSVIFMSLVALSMAVLNAHDVYASPALAPVMLNVAIIVGTWLGASFLDVPIMGVVYGVLVGCVVQLVIQAPALAKQMLMVRPRFQLPPEVRGFWWQMVPGLFALAVYQVNIIVLRQLSSHLVEGSVTHLYLADRLLELCNGVFAIAIAQGAFSSMTEHAQRGDHDQLKSVWRFSFLLQNMVAIPAAIGLAVIAEPVVAVLFLHGRFAWSDVEETARCVRYAAVGLVAAATVRGSVQMFYALDDRKTPLVASIVVVVLNALLGISLMRLGLGVVSLSATLSASYVVQAVLLVMLLRRRLGAMGGAVIIKQAMIEGVLGAVAGIAAAAVCSMGNWRAGTTVMNTTVLLLAIAAAAVLYAGGVTAMRLQGTEMITAKIARRLRRSSPSA